jgi:hypothetical protein
VTFLDGTNTLGTATLSGSPTATAKLTVESLPSGSHTIRARYNGAGTCPAAQSSPVTVAVPRPILPVTGVGLPATVAAGILLVLAGAALVLASHRRRPAHRITA